METRLKIGGQFSGVGAFDQALKRLNIHYENVYQAEWDKYARQTYLHNYEIPEYYVQDVYDTPTEEITEKHGSLDLMMFSPPCQAFSLAGKRKGEEDKRGVLFYNSHEFIKVNKPRFFIFENVKGLLSDAGGKTFQRWIDYLGGKSVNGNPVIFPSSESVPYHVYYTVLNAKNYGIPQNRERVFIVGIRDNEDNLFTWPKEEFLTKRLKDVLESEVDEKYYLSDKMIEGLISHKDRHIEKGTGFQWEPRDLNGTASCLRANAAFAPTDNSIKVKSATSKGYEIAQIGEDSINLEHPNSETRRGRVDEKVAQTLTTSCDQGVAEVNVVANLPGKHEQNSRVYGTNGVSPTLTTMQGGGQEPKVLQINPSKESGGVQPYQHNRIYDSKGIMTTLDTKCGRPSVTTIDYRIRKLTPRECFRLMDFPESFTWPVSDSQAYKQAGNSICVGVLAKIISKLKLN